MKKILIFIVIFAVIAVMTTFSLIRFQKGKVVLEENSTQGTENTEKENQAKEKTLDLYSTFEENALEIETISMEYEGFKNGITYPQIHGLKNKEVEDKINRDIDEKVKYTLKQLVQSGRENLSFRLLSIYGG